MGSLMINQFLALLDGSPVDPQLVPWPAFTSASYTDTAKEVRRLLMPPAATRYEQFVRSYCLTAIVAASSLREYVTKGDSRLAGDRPSVMKTINTFGSVVVGAQDANLWVVYGAATPNYGSWNVQLTDGELTIANELGAITHSAIDTELQYQDVRNTLSVRIPVLVPSGSWSVYVQQPGGNWSAPIMAGVPSVWPTLSKELRDKTNGPSQIDKVAAVIVAMAQGELINEA